MTLRSSSLYFALALIKVSASLNLGLVYMGKVTDGYEFKIHLLQRDPDAECLPHLQVVAFCLGEPVIVQTQNFNPGLHWLCVCCLSSFWHLLILLGIWQKPPVYILTPCSLKPSIAFSIA